MLVVSDKYVKITVIIVGHNPQTKLSLYFHSGIHCCVGKGTISVVTVKDIALRLQTFGAARNIKA